MSEENEDLSYLVDWARQGKIPEHISRNIFIEYAPKPTDPLSAGPGREVARTLMNNWPTDGATVRGGHWQPVTRRLEELATEARDYNITVDSLKLWYEFRRLRKQGLTWQLIADQFGYNLSKVEYHRKKMIKTGFLS